MKIVIAVDGSNESMEAVRLLSRLPFKAPPTVVVATALVDIIDDMIDADMLARMSEEQASAAQKHYEEVNAILKSANIASEFESAFSHPSKFITDVAQRHHADLIVLGARGHSAAFRILLGSTADYVANHAKCPVLVARPANGEKKPTGCGFSIALAFDGSAGATVAWNQLQSFAWDASTCIDIYTFLERPSLLPDDEIYDEAALTSAEKSLVALKDSSPFGSTMHPHVREVVHVGNALLDCASQKGTDIVFIGDTGRSAFMRFFLGSKSRYVLHHAPSSVWIARDVSW